MVGFSNLIFRFLVLIRSQLGFRIQDGAECGNNKFMVWFSELQSKAKFFIQSFIDFENLLIENMFLDCCTVLCFLDLILQTSKEICVGYTS